jgi:hypothetical protein
MKKGLLLILLICFSINIQAQKKRTTTKKVVEKPVVLVKYDPKNIEVQYFNKTITVYYTIDEKKDTLFTEKTIDAVNSNFFSIKEFKAGNKNLLLFSWTENITNKTDLLKEDMFVAENQVWDFDNKKRLVKNKQKRGTSEKIHFLSKQKDASETIYSKINDGRSFSLLANGDYTLSSDKGTDKFVYNATDNKYAVVVPKTTSKKNTARRR